MKEMQTMDPRVLLGEAMDFLGASLQARRTSLFLNHEVENGGFRHKIK